MADGLAQRCRGVGKSGNSTERIVGIRTEHIFEHRCFDNLSDSQRAASPVGMGLWRFRSFAARRYSFAAASSVAMSNFTIVIIAAIALECFRISPIFSGTICQHRPNLSVSQPQAMGLPPSSSFSQ